MVKYERHPAPEKLLRQMTVETVNLLALIYALAQKKQYYNTDKVFGEVRKTQLAAA